MHDRGAILDISPRLSSRTAVFPGDTALTREVAYDMKRGDTITLSALRTTVHCGAHADAPSHYACLGRTIDDQPLDLYWGPCEVVRVRASCLGTISRVGRAHLEVDAAWRPTTRRLLIATGSCLDSEVWNPKFLALDPPLVDLLADGGVALVGIDTPSVDCSDSKDLPAHQRFAARDVAILEGLVLDGVTAGFYELCALPLALVGFDGSPVRAALRRQPTPLL